MSAIDLYGEMKAATFAVRQPHMDRLRALGVSTDFIADLGARFFPFGICAAEVQGDGTYQPGEGNPHVIMPVLEDGELVDLIAWRTSTPGDWHLRTGNGWALGAEWVASHEDIDVFGSPLGWMIGRGEGICPLDWSAPELDRFRSVETLRAEDAETAQLLAAVLRKPVRIPTIRIREIAHAA